jgi:hypothetical protein
MKPKKKNKKDDWLDPTAPSKAMGELGLVLGDCEDSIRDCVENLHSLGVKTEWLRESDQEESQCRFRSKDMQLARIAQEAYQLGISREIYKSVWQELDSLSKKLVGTRNSRKTKAAKKEKRQIDFLVVYAAEMAKADVSIKSVAKACEIPLSTAYAYLKEFAEDVRKTRDRLRKQNPAQSAAWIEATIVKDYASEPGINVATVHAALKAERRK